MRIYFLGTGTSQGIPVIGSTHPVCLSQDPKDKRLRVSVWVSWEGCSIVIDCGPDFRQQMLISGCDKIDALLLTHEHSDHTAGLDDIRPFNFKYGDLPIYAHKRVIENLKGRFAYIFETENRYPGAPAVTTHEVVNNCHFEIGGKKITPINAFHADLQVFGFRIDDFAYLTDVKTIPDEEVEKLLNLKILVINALREDEHHSHLSLSEALKLVQRVQPGRTYLTHISHTLGFHQEVQNSLPENVYLAYDNLDINL